MLPLELSRQWIAEDLTDEAYQAVLDYEIPSEA